MLDWCFLALERYGTSSATRLARSAGIVPHWVVRRIAEAKLARTLRHVWRHNELQRGRWQEAGVRWRDLRSARVLERIPILDPNELALDPEPFRCVPKDDLTFLMTTSGTGGRKRKIYFTTPDIDNQAILLGAALRRLPGASCVLVLIGATDASWGPLDMARRAVEKAGLLGLHTQGQTPAKLLESIREHHPNVIISLPTVMHRHTIESADVDLRALGVKYIVLSSQPLPGTLRTLLEEKWGAAVIDLYATNEHGAGIAAECPKGEGLHVAETDFWIEIVDPETGKPVPDGTEGEMLITTLSRRGMPLVRYRIRDLSRFLPYTGRCSCGVPLRKIAPIRGRVDHMLKLGPGLNFYPDEFDRAVFSVPGVTDYQLTVGKQGYKDVLSLTVETKEPDDGLNGRLLEALSTVSYLKYIGTERGIVLTGEFKAVPPGTLSKGRRKSVRIVDQRVL